MFIYITTKKDYDFYDYSKFISERNKIIFNAKKEEKESVAIKIHELYNNNGIPISVDLNDISNDYKDYPNIHMGRYYGIKIYGYN